MITYDNILAMITQMQQDALHVCDALRNLIASTRVRALQQDEVPRPLSNPIDMSMHASIHVSIHMTANHVSS